MQLILSAKNLFAKLKESKLLVVDTRPFAEYLAGHVPGAVNIDLFQFHWTDTSRQGIKEFQRQSRILHSNMGVKNNQMVVFYDNLSGMSAARGVWLLLYFSHRNVHLLDGGFEQWKCHGFPIETKTNHFVPSHFTGRPNPRVIASFSDVKNSLEKRNTVIIDARTNEEFTGLHVRAARAGHIPSAINMNWEQNIDDGCFKSSEGLQKLYSNIPKSSKIITYCQGGYRAANTFLALKILGYKDVRMYLGSWGEWGNKLDLPIEQSK
ncbi:MAG TPA: sulfurtransferase [Nitrososphaeraceae archaeon]|jgi:thiosulfate/3-mercaptopyruvate sulfurtransferase